MGGGTRVSDFFLQRIQIQFFLWGGGGGGGAGVSEFLLL